jgi:biotin-[acetyl-CoA-carboxylase] ligase BirA-like protein
MRVISDVPELARPFAEADLRPARLSGAEQVLWQTLGRGSPWQAAGSDDFWGRLLVIGDAPASQFDALGRALGRELAADVPTACLALTGRRFRGQRDRSWQVAPGNLFLSVVLAPRAVAQEIVASLVMLPAVAVVDAIQRLGGRASIKWVNDVLIDGRKVGGVLASSHCKETLLESAVLGIGVNVAHAPEVAPTAFVPGACSLAEAGIEVGLPRFLFEVLHALALRYRALMERGPAGLRLAYQEASCVVGAEVGIWSEATDLSGDPSRWPAPLRRGRVTAIGADLSLTLEGSDEPVTRGRLALLDRTDPSSSAT